MSNHVVHQSLLKPHLVANVDRDWTYWSLGASIFVAFMAGLGWVGFAAGGMLFSGLMAVGYRFTQHDTDFLKVLLPHMLQQDYYPALPHIIARPLRLPRGTGLRSKV